MIERPDSTSTRRLVEDLINQGLDLISIEIDLFRSELKSSSAKASLGIRSLVTGASFLLAGLLSVVAALCALLVRIGLPVDAACFVVAVVAVLIGWALLRSGMRALQPKNLMPVRSFGQISSLLRWR
jgi:VIT1/CCC1 family predicted Fe2+/Mn2+ transporter